MRYEKTESLLRLAFEMQGSAEGLSLADIMQCFAVSRRTAERMRDAVLRVFPQADERRGDDSLKRWRIPSERGIVPTPVTADELATLRAARLRFERESLNEQAVQLAALEAKLRSLLAPAALNRIAPDYEALVEAEGLALRPGPRPRIAPAVIRDLRDCIKACETVRLHYRARNSGALSRQAVHPYGFLYGNRHYLVAFNTNPEVGDFRLFSLANIKRVERSGEHFRRDETFSLDDYARRSFGVFQEEPVEVVWRVAAEAAGDARDYLFHPGQRIEEKDDGSLLVSFRAGGLLEMCWCLFTWGGAVTIVEPKELATLMRRQLRAMSGGMKGRSRDEC